MAILIHVLFANLYTVWFIPLSRFTSSEILINIKFHIELVWSDQICYSKEQPELFASRQHFGQDSSVP